MAPSKNLDKHAHGHAVPTPLSIAPPLPQETSLRLGARCRKGTAQRHLHYYYYHHHQQQMPRQRCWRRRRPAATAGGGSAGGSGRRARGCLAWTDEPPWTAGSDTGVMG